MRWCMLMLGLACALQVISAQKVTITAKTEVPLTVTTAMRSDMVSPSSNSSYTSNTQSGNGFTFSSTSVTFTSRGPSGNTSPQDEEAVQSDRVGIQVKSDNLRMVFNVGPTLDKMGLEVLEAPLTQSMGTTRNYAVRRVLIEDGANIQPSDNGMYPVVNVSITSEPFNFTYGSSIQGTSEYTICTRVEGSNVTEATIIAPRNIQTRSFPANMAISSVNDVFNAINNISDMSQPDAKEGLMQADLLVTIADPVPAKISLVNAKGLFALKVPQTLPAAPKCTTKTCAAGDTSCLKNLSI